jgi:uncharacterized protein (TIGR02391 family)
MARSSLDRFEGIARRVGQISERRPLGEDRHPFEVRDIHEALPAKVRKLFDDAHYAEATVEACKFLDGQVRKLAKLGLSGEKLMMDAFSEAKAVLRLNGLGSVSEKDEQRGYKFIFAGTFVGIRNPRSHESIKDVVGTCLDHLSLVSHLLRRLEAANFPIG